MLEMVSAALPVTDTVMTRGVLAPLSQISSEVDPVFSPVTNTPALLRFCLGQGAVWPLLKRVAKKTLFASALGLALTPVPGAAQALRVSRALWAGHEAFRRVKALEAAAQAVCRDFNRSPSRSRNVAGPMAWAEPGLLHASST